MDKGTREYLDGVQDTYESWFPTAGFVITQMEDVFKVYLPKMLEEIEQADKFRMLVYRLMFEEQTEDQYKILQQELVEMFKNQVQYESEDADESDEDSGVGLDGEFDGGIDLDSDESSGGNVGSENPSSGSRHSNQYDNEEENDS